MSTPERRLRIGRAAQILGVHVDTLRRWADDGVLPSTRTQGNERRFLQADLEEFLARPAPEPPADKTRAAS